MSEYDLRYYEGEASRLALEIQRKLVILSLDWTDEQAMRALARRVLSVNHDGKRLEASPGDSAAWVELCGLIGLMNQLMAESAGKNVQVHGNDAWKAVARALWAEKEAQRG